MSTLLTPGDNPVNLNGRIEHDWAVEGLTVTVKVDPIGVKEVDILLTRCEEHFGMPSDRFLEAFRNGTLHETPEFRDWASLLATRQLTERLRAS